MHIAVLKEIKKDENRVALQPKQVAILIENGHTVFVEKGAGINAGFTDEKYKKYGANLVDKSVALKKSTLILKVKAPLKNEYNDYTKEQILFTYLHFDENIKPKEIKELIKSGFSGIAYEWVGENGDYPLLHPMSRLTGYLFAQKSFELLSKYKGVLAGKYENEHKGANILLIGLGTIGMSAFQYFNSNNANITIIDKHPNTINQRLNQRFLTKDKNYISNAKIISFDIDSIIETLQNSISKFDIILNCAVRRPNLPKEKLEYLIDANMIKKMSKGSVICDTTACDKDFIETCISSSELEKIDIINGVIHYNCDHIPSYVANTSTKLLTNQTFPYILELANKGFWKAINENKYLKNGVSCRDTYICHEYSASKKDMIKDFKKIDDLF